MSALYDDMAEVGGEEDEEEEDEGRGNLGEFESGADLDEEEKRAIEEYDRRVAERGEIGEVEGVAREIEERLYFALNYHNF